MILVTSRCYCDINKLPINLLIRRSFRPYKIMCDNLVKNTNDIPRYFNYMKQMFGKFRNKKVGIFSKYCWAIIMIKNLVKSSTICVSFQKKKKNIRQTGSSPLLIHNSNRLRSVLIRK